MFFIKKIKKLSAGREFVKEETVEKEEISIGRSTDCEIYLPDLRVALNHARIVPRGAKGFAVAALGDKPVQVDGRFGRQFTFKTGQVAALRFGAYHLDVSRRADGNFDIAIEQVSEEALVKPDEDESKIFSLRKNFWGKRSVSWIGLISLLGVFLILPMMWFFGGHDSEKIAGYKPDQPWLSGEMSLAHASLASDCQSCHKQAFQSVPDKVCSDCHEGLPDHADKNDMRTAQPDSNMVKAQLANLSSFFGRPPERCSSCHSEHNGGTGIILTAQNLCSDCHQGLSKKLPKSIVQDASDFGRDHPEFRPTLVETVANNGTPMWRRVSMDDSPVEKSGLKFPHDIHLEKDGGVANMAADLRDQFGGRTALECVDCHKPDAGGVLFETPRMETNCAMCHTLGFDQEGDEIRTLRHGKPKEVIASMRDFYLAQALKNITEQTELDERRRPGAAARLAADRRRQQAIDEAEQRTAIAVTAIFSEGGACYDCHTVIEPQPGPDGIDFADYDIEKVVLADQFMPWARFNHDKHESGDLECADCHQSEKSDSATDVLLPKIAECRDCHGGAEADNMVPSTCVMCHGFHEDMHDATGMMKPRRIKNNKEMGLLEQPPSWPKRG